MAQSRVWKHLSMKHIYDFNEFRTPEKGRLYIASVMKLNPEMNDKTAILMDFLYYLLSFAKENGLTPPQASAFFSIMLETHERCTETSFINLAEDFDFFKTLLLQHSVNRPPYSQKVFSLDDLKLITDYALNTYFRHYLMYKYVFTKKLKLDFAVEAETQAIGGATSSEDNCAVEPDDTGDTSVANVIELTDSSPPDAQKEAPIEQEPVSNTIAVSENTSIEPQIMELKENEPVTAPPEVAQALDPQTRHEAAVLELKGLVTNLVGSKLDEIRMTFEKKVKEVDDTIVKKLGKLDPKKK